MTPDQHNKYVGIAHLSYAGFQLLMFIVAGVFIALVLSDVDAQAGRDTMPWFVVIVIAFAFLVNIVVMIPPIIAGYALLKRRPWAKVAGVVGGAVGILNFPVGWALAAYTFWFLFSDAGKQIYDKDFRVSQPPLPPPPDLFAADRV